MNALTGYPVFLASIKDRIQHAQTRASLALNRELISLYWETGRLIIEKQKNDGWGAGVIPQLARDIQAGFPSLKGFSERNLKYMTLFAREYGVPNAIVQQPAAQLQHAAEKAYCEKLSPAGAMNSKMQQLAAQIPWMHNVLLLERVKDRTARQWYMQHTIEHGWSRSVLAAMIQSDACGRSGTAVTNFAATLPDPQSDLARQLIKDPYVFDFLTLDADFRERDLEQQLLEHLQRFLIELGNGFAFVGRQHRLDVDGEEFFVDLLFYHLRLRSFIVIELKIGAFKPEYAGKMNFYLNAVDATLRHRDDQPSIGLILCQERNRVVAEYALRGMSKPIGISEYELTRALPQELASSLPTIEQIEAEFGQAIDDHSGIPD